MVLATLFLLPGCASQPPEPTAHTTPRATAAVHDNEIVSVLHDQHSDWAGTPYRLGGNSRQGIDCSAFVRTTFQQHFGRTLPRTTRAQTAVGNPVEPARIEPGDLVFFRTGRNKRHVGIYVEGGRFLHASTSRGVTLSELDNPYWSSTFWMARRP